MASPSFLCCCLGVAVQAHLCGETRVRSRQVRETVSGFYIIIIIIVIIIILTAPRIPPHQPQIHLMIGDAGSRKLRRFGG